MTEPLNPYAESEHASLPMTSEDQRVLQEVKAAIVAAQIKPRDKRRAVDELLRECARPSLAKVAMYAFPRGGQMIEGPSIRLAETIAQCWGNMQTGTRVLNQNSKESLVESYAWDTEKNNRDAKVFSVPHQRKARGTVQTLEDPRDIYEHIQNQAQRRKRSCILAVIPRDVIDAAERQINITLQHSEGSTEEQITELVTAFKKYDVTPQMIAQRLGHDLEATIQAEFSQLRKIYASLRDGMSTPKDWFTVEETRTASERSNTSTTQSGDNLAELREKLRQRQKTEPAGSTDEEPGGPLEPTMGTPWEEDGVWRVIAHNGEIEIWDPAIHSENRTVTKEGRFRRRRGAQETVSAPLDPEPLQSDSEPLTPSGGPDAPEPVSMISYIKASEDPDSVRDWLAEASDHHKAGIYTNENLVAIQNAATHRLEELEARR